MRKFGALLIVLSLPALLATWPVRRRPVQQLRTDDRARRYEGQ